MSSAAAVNRAMGLDRGLPFPLEDIPQASVILLAGGNPAETMPPIMQYFEAQQRNGGQLIVADPRRTATAHWAGRHLRLKPGTDAALANGLLHVLIRDGLVDETFVQNRTEGFEDARRTAMTYWPERVERITGVSEAAIVEVAHALGRAPRAMILTARGPEQQAQGVTNALAYINVALAIGAVGKLHSGFGTLTGQGNGQGGREQGQKADQLPGYRLIENAADRRHMAAVWNVPESELPRSGKSAVKLLNALGTEIHGLLLMGSNPVVSAPDALRVENRLAALDTLVVADFFPSETTAHADIVLPAAQWPEEGGTMTNLEGRIVLRRRVCVPPPGVRTDLEILSGIAAAMGRGSWFAYANEAEVFDELRRATAGATADYSGVTYARIEQEDGVFWPCPAADSPGTPRLYAEPSRGIYKKLVIRNDRIVGAILIGDGRLVPSVAQAFADEAALAERRSELLFPPPFDQPRRAPEQMSDDAQVCDCNTVSKARIVDAVLRGASSLRAVCEHTHAGTGCGSCRPEVQRIMDMAHRSVDAPELLAPAAAPPATSTAGAEENENVVVTLNKIPHVTGKRTPARATSYSAPTPSAQSKHANV